MKKLQYKTNINCSNCIKSVTPFLNNEFSIIEWSVDTDNPEKILTVEGEEGELESAQIMKVVKDAGFKIEEV